jgi:large subunit ribosomal protein L10
LFENAMDVAEIKTLAKLPSLDALRGKILGMLNTPATRIAGVVQAPAGQLARVVHAHASQDEAA